jgi:hypothetical protein
MNERGAAEIRPEQVGHGEVHLLQLAVGEVALGEDGVLEVEALEVQGRQVHALRLQPHAAGPQLQVQQGVAHALEEMDRLVVGHRTAPVAGISPPQESLAQKPKNAITFGLTLRIAKETAIMRFGQGREMHRNASISDLRCADEDSILGK